MGKVYKDKKSKGCALCKPHKHGWAPKKKVKVVSTEKDMDREINDMSKNKIKSMNIAEASDYFDEHDIFETGDVKEVTDIKFSLKKKKYVGLDTELFKKITSKAKKLHKSEDVLIKEWLTEKVG